MAEGTMNELIQALLLQSKNPNTGMVEEEKFADLIVKECAEVVAGYYDERTMQWAGPRIAQHFGVEP